MHKKIALFALSVACVATSSSVLAQTTSGTGTSAGSVKKAEVQTQRDQNKADQQAIKDQKQQNVESKCKEIENRVATRVQRYESNQQMIQTTYTNMRARLDRLVVRLKSAGADTTTLEQDLKTLYAKMDKTQTDNTTFMSTLKETQSFACGKSDGEFKGKLGEAKKIDPVVRQDRLDVKKYFETTIKADLKKIRETLVAQKTENKTETTGVPQGNFNSPNPNLTNQEPAPKPEILP